MTDIPNIPSAEPIAKEPTQPPKKGSGKSTNSQEKSEFSILETILHDGETYNPDDTISLTEKQAQPLLALGVIKG